MSKAKLIVGVSSVQQKYITVYTKKYFLSLSLYSCSISLCFGLPTDQFILDNLPVLRLTTNESLTFIWWIYLYLSFFNWEFFQVWRKHQFSLLAMMSPEIKHCRTSVKLSLNNQKLPVQLVSTKVQQLYDCLRGISYISSGVRFFFLYQNRARFGESLSKANNFHLLVNLSSHWYWSIWTPLLYTVVTAEKQKYLLLPPTVYFTVYLLHVCILPVLDYRERGAMFQWRVSEGLDWPLLLSRLYLETNNSLMIGCPLENIYADWTDHLACHRINMRSDCQHVIWEFPS